MQALGFMETKGFVVAIVAADAMVKAANVMLLEKVYVGSGLVSVSIGGDVGAVKAAVEAGKSAIEHINKDLLMAYHVIPRHHKELEKIIKVNRDTTVCSTSNTGKDQGLEQKVKGVLKEATDEKAPISETEAPISEKKSISFDGKKVTKKDVDHAAKHVGANRVMEGLMKLKVTELRRVARAYDDFGINGRKLSKANKKELIKGFGKFYSKATES